MGTNSVKPGWRMMQTPCECGMSSYAILVQDSYVCKECGLIAIVNEADYSGKIAKNFYEGKLTIGMGWDKTAHKVVRPNR
jgi:hypothetical protein